MVGTLAAGNPALGLGRARSPRCRRDLPWVLTDGLCSSGKGVVVLVWAAGGWCCGRH